MKIENNVLLGILLTSLACMAWNNQSNPPQIYIKNWRIHHYHIGLGLVVLGLQKKIPILVAAGSVLLLDDRKDLLNDFNKFFKN